MTDLIPAPLKLYTTKELAALYGIHPKTFLRFVRRHREEIGKREGHNFSILQVEIIFRLYGWPMIKSRE
jgi:hypothetical protein